MSPKLPRVTAEDLLRALRRNGCREARQRGSHIVLVHERKPGIVVVPRHKGQGLPPGLIARILRDAALTPDELRMLL